MTDEYEVVDVSEAGIDMEAVIVAHSLQRALSTVKRLSEEATQPQPWMGGSYYDERAKGLSFEVMDGTAGKIVGTAMSEADAALIAAAPDLAASVVEIAEALADALTALEGATDTHGWTPKRNKAEQKSRAALASFASRFGAEP